MPRSNRPRRGRVRTSADPGVDDLEARVGHGGGRLERHSDGDWHVQPVTGAAATKPYLCPGCRQQVPPGTPHVVTWPADRLGAFGGPDDRRHWHTPCWSARSRRR